MNPVEVRCKSCNRWLATATVMVAAVKCPRCKMIFEYKIVSSLHLSNAYDIISHRDQESTPHKAVVSVKDQMQD